MSIPKIWYVSTKVDDDIKYSDKLFDKKVKTVLKHPKGWEYAFRESNNDKDLKSNKKYINFKFVQWNQLPEIKSENKISIRLSSDDTLQKICGFSNKLSCCDMSTKECWLNFYRWMNGSEESKLSLYKYRNYMINHEVGHALGKLHAECPCIGCSAPIMMQHTVSIGQCKPNDQPIKGE